MLEVRHQIIETDDDYRMIVVSDIHGHLDLFKQLLKKVNYNQNDYLVINGDFVEKGDQVLETVQYVHKLDKNERTYVLLGNCEWALYSMLTIERMAPQIPHYLERIKSNGCIRQAYHKFNLYEESDPLKVQHILHDYLSDVVDYIGTLSTTLKWNDYLFVHAGVDKEKDYKECSLSILLELKDFLHKGHSLNETVIVGHFPTSNYKSVIDNNIIINHDKKIISIDGGVGVKPVCQLNALIIEKHHGQETIKSEYVTSYPVYSIKDDVRVEEKPVHKIAYPDFEVKLVTKGKDFSRCCQVNTGDKFYIKNEFLYQNKDRLFCQDDYTDCFLSVDKGDTIEVIAIYGSWVYGISNKKVGWLKASHLDLSYCKLSK